MQILAIPLPLQVYIGMTPSPVLMKAAAKPLKNVMRIGLVHRHLISFSSMVIKITLKLDLKLDFLKLVDVRLFLTSCNLVRHLSDSGSIKKSSHH